MMSHYEADLPILMMLPTMMADETNDAPEGLLPTAITVDPLLQVQTMDGGDLFSNNNKSSNHNIIQQSCPDAASMFCDSVNAIAGISSFEGDGADAGADASGNLKGATTTTAATLQHVLHHHHHDQQQSSPRSVLVVEQQRQQQQQACFLHDSSKSCFASMPPSPGDGGSCQRRGRFLIWPASLTSPSLGFVVADAQRA